MDLPANHGRSTRICKRCKIESVPRQPGMLERWNVSGRLHTLGVSGNWRKLGDIPNIAV